MKNSGGSTLRFLLFLIAVGVPYTIFYYPVDIYGFLPVRAFLAVSVLLYALVRILAFFTRGRDSREASNESSRTKGRWKIIAAGLVLLVIILIATGRFSDAVSFAAFQGVRFVIQPFFYIGILWSLSVPLFVFAAAISFVAGLTAAKFLRRRLFSAVLWGFWTLVCFSLVYFIVFKAGPGINECSRLKPVRGARLLLSRNSIDSIPGMKGALPYDAVADEKRGFLFVSLKQTGARPGGIAMAGIKSGRIINAIPAARAVLYSLRVNVFPERMSINPARREIYAIILSPGHSRLIAASYKTGFLNVVRDIPLGGEPNNVYSDSQRSRVYVFYAGATKHGYTVHDAKTLAVIKDFYSDGIRGSMQHIDSCEKRGTLYATVFGANKIVEINTASMRPARMMKQSSPLEGIACDCRGGTIFATVPFSHGIQIFDIKKLRPVGANKASCGLADAAYDPLTRSAFIAGYNGTIDIFGGTKPWPRRARIKIGRLLRNISPSYGGKLYACSGCGVFEISADSFINSR